MHKSSGGLCFWAADPLSIDFNKIYQLKGLEPKNKGHKNFYECCDLTKKYIKRKWMVRITFVLQRKNFD